MTTATSVKDELHALIDAMDDRAAIRALMMISLLDDDGEFSDEEIAEILEAEEDFRNGTSIRGEDLERDLGFTG